MSYLTWGCFPTESYKLILFLLVYLHTTFESLHIPDASPLTCRLYSHVNRNHAFVCRQLIKNLFLNYFSAPSAKRSEVLHLLARVLDFSDQDHERIGLGGGSNWVSNLWKRMQPQAVTTQQHDQVRRQLIREAAVWQGWEPGLGAVGGSRGWALWVVAGAGRCGVNR